MTRNIKYILVLIIINLFMLIIINVTLRDKIGDREIYLQEITKAESTKNFVNNMEYSKILNNLKDENINILGFKHIGDKNISVKVEMVSNIHKLNNFIKKIEDKSNLSRINNIEIRKNNKESNSTNKMDIEFTKTK